MTERRICVSMELAMSALILTGGLQAVLPGKLAVRGNRGEQCAVCESCKSLSLQDVTLSC